MNEVKNHGAFNGPLRKNQVNPRYFTDDSGKAVYLTGSHNWENFQDLIVDGVDSLVYDEYLDFMESNNHNFMRMWVWEHAAWVQWSEEKYVFDPIPYIRTGPGMALDGKPKFDLDQWNESYFERLRSRVIEAGKRGIYVSVMLFQGWSIKKSWFPQGDPWRGHPFHQENNISGVNGDPDGDGNEDIFSLMVHDVTARQEAYIRKVVDTVNDLDNVLYEIINELTDSVGTVAWHYHMVDYVKKYEARKPKQHPVGMTAIGHLQENSILLNSAADWISPGNGDDEEYRYNPPVSNGKKVILSDTDHLWGHGGDQTWVWKSFTRGLNPIFMDPWRPIYGFPMDNNQCGLPEWELIRKNMGYTKNYAGRMDMNQTIPCKELTSTGYCIANAGKEYLAYLNGQKVVSVDLSSVAGEFAVEWLNILSGKVKKADKVEGGTVMSFTIPHDGDWILFLYR